MVEEQNQFDGQDGKIERVMKDNQIFNHMILDNYTNNTRDLYDVDFEVDNERATTLASEVVKTAKEYLRHKHNFDGDDFLNYENLINLFGLDQFELQKMFAQQGASPSLLEAAVNDASKRYIGKRQMYLAGEFASNIFTDNKDQAFDYIDSKIIPDKIKLDRDKITHEKLLEAYASILQKQSLKNKEYVVEI